jgi:hypothetical protein
MGFYTYTGLVSTDVEVGSVTSTTAFAEAPSVAASVLVSVPLAKLKRKAIIAALRGTPIGFGNSDGCLIIPPDTSCQQRRFSERVTMLVGGAFDIRETLLRVTAGPSLYSVEKSGTRIGTQVRLDFTSPRQGSRMPTMFLSRTFLGSQNGRGFASRRRSRFPHGPSPLPLRSHALRRARGGRAERLARDVAPTLRGRSLHAGGGIR